MAAIPISYTVACLNIHFSSFWTYIP